MDYDCQTIQADKLLVNPQGVQEPLCNDCRSPDCTNPIRDRVVSILGIPTTMRLWVVNNMVRQVVACPGYLPPGDKDVAMGSASPTPYVSCQENTPITIPGDNAKSEESHKSS